MAADKQWISWNKNISHPYNELHRPSSTDELAEIVQKSEQHVRVIGTGRSSADIVAGSETLISLENYTEILSIDTEKQQVTVQTGITLEALINDLAKHQLCIPCLPDIDDITLGGALATGTHGTGIDGHPISGYMTGCSLVKADGTILEINEDSEILEAVRVSLGALGIIATVTLQCEPLYTMTIKEGSLKDAYWMNNFLQMIKNNDFLRILWIPHTNHGYVIKGNRCGEDEEVPTIDGPWHHKYRRTMSKLLYRFADYYPPFIATANKILYRLFFSSKQQKSGTLYDATVTKSRGSTLELAEWTIRADKFIETFTELRQELHSFSNKAFAHIPMDIRYIRADKSWLSYAYNADTVTVGCVTRNADTADSYEAFNKIEEVFYKHGGRPHWAKRHALKANELRTLYPKWDQFNKLRKEMDPDGKFLNNYLTELFGEA